MHPVTLPIDTADGLRMDPKEARALGTLLAEDYRSADPFPHIVMEGILPEPLIRKIHDHSRKASPASTRCCPPRTSTAAVFTRPRAAASSACMPTSASTSS